MSTKNDNNNAQLNENNETNCDISLPLLKTNNENEVKAIIVNNENQKEKKKNYVQRHEYFLPPMLLSYGPGECDSDIELSNKTGYGDLKNTNKPEKHPEISALSVLSLLENNDELEKEMDTSK